MNKLLKALDLLNNIILFTETELFYWGDLDDEGFAMLNNSRAYYSHTRSIFMDKKRVEKHSIELICQVEKFRTRDFQHFTSDV